MCWHAQRVLPGDGRSAGDGRRFCGGQLAHVLGRGPAAQTVIDATELVVSELITNAVMAGSSSIDMDLTVHRDHVRVAVADDAPGTPTLQRPSARDEHGRGLTIVSAISRDWGVEPEASGKVVWASVALPADLIFQLDCQVSAA